MNNTKSNNQNTNMQSYNISESGLQYKDHDKFFDIYYEMRTKVSYLISKTRDNPDKSQELIAALEDLFRWTNAQVRKIRPLKDIHELFNDLYHLENAGKYNDVYNKCVVFFDELSECHEQTELIPKVQIERIDKEQEFWAGERNKGLREVKKAFYDLFIAQNE